MNGWELALAIACAVVSVGSVWGGVLAVQDSPSDKAVLATAWYFLARGIAVLIAAMVGVVAVAVASPWAMGWVLATGLVTALTQIIDAPVWFGVRERPLYGTVAIVFAGTVIFLGGMTVAGG